MTGVYRLYFSLVRMPMASNPAKSEKWRNGGRERVPTSCSMCRKRKAKCDKSKPICNSCITSGNTHQCTYDKHPWMSIGHDNGSQIEIDILREKVRVLEENLLTTYEQLASLGATNVSGNASVSAQLVERDEPTIRLSKVFGGLTVKESALTYFGPTSYMSVFLNDSYSSRMFRDYTESQLQGYREHWEMPNVKTPCSDSKSNHDDSKVVSDLPPLRIVIFLVERFFDICYPFAPFINKPSFMQEMSLALVQKGNTTILTQQGKLLHGTIALVLIMMRFAYISLPIQQYNSDSLHGDLEQMIKEMVNYLVDIRPSYISRANILISAAGCLSRISLRSIQAALLLRTYKLFCPEGNEGGTESNILVGTVIQMARFHGMHRNPDTYESTIVDEETKYLWNKIWAHLLFLDASQAFNLGSQLNIYEEGHFPLFELPNPAPANELPLIFRNFALKAKVTMIMRKLVKSTTKSDNTKRPILVDLANQLTTLMCHEIRTFDRLVGADDVSDSNVCDRALEFCMRLDLTYKLYIIYFLLYSSADDLFESQLKQKYFCAAVEHGLIILRIGIAFCDTPSSFFGYLLEKLVAQNIFLSVYRTLVSLSSVVLRIMDGTVSINNTVKGFRTADSAGLVPWLTIDPIDEEVGLHSLISKFRHLYNSTTNLASTYFLCYRVSWGMKYVLDYIGVHYPKLVEDVTQVQTNFTDDFSDIYSSLDEMWNNVSAINFDYIFASLGVGDMD